MTSGRVGRRLWFCVAIAGIVAVFVVVPVFFLRRAGRRSASEEVAA